MIKKQSLTFFVLFSLLTSVIFSQHREKIQQIEDFNKGARNEYLDVGPSSENSSTLFSLDGTTKTIEEDQSEQLEVIIEFNEEPYFIKRTKNKNIDESFYTSRFSQLQDNLIELNNMQLGKISSSDIGEIRIKKKFHKLYFGASATVPRGMLTTLSNLSYVRKIHLSRKFECTLENSKSIIKVDSVWDQFGVYGDSVLIAILDTGIDYLHPDLGGGYGPGYKVIGGYNFYGDNPNFLDDHGHGTHVAGIVAADGDSIKGVAPKSNLLAVKVLGEDGGAFTDDIIAGIEYCADPNGDGNTDDMVDIMNLSLGTFNGYPEDPASQAINNASLLGITACVAAGNEEYFFTIRSPGTAETAITVGATNDADELAYFSSKGPTKGHYSIKPDVLAPGVDINSLKLGGGYVEKSGTSMATPHVTGVCALLKSIHPEWGPQELKSALMSTAVDIGEEVMAQGAGRIDALEAANVTTIFSPAHLSFGMDNTEEQEWAAKDTLWITNHLPSSQTYSFEQEYVHSGINVVFHPETISIAGSSKQMVEVELMVDNQIVPYPERDSYSYGGNISVIGERKYSIPFGFVKAPMLIITSDVPQPLIKLFGPSYNGNVRFQNDLYETEIVLPADTYDILTWEANYYFDNQRVLVKENLEINGFHRVSLDFEKAKNIIVFEGVDVNGNTFEESAKECFVFVPRISNLLALQITFSADTIFFGDISDRYQVSLSEFSLGKSGNQAFNVHHDVAKGISQSKILINDPTTFVSREFELNIPDEQGFATISHNGIIKEFIEFPTQKSTRFRLGIDNYQCTGELFISEFTNELYSPAVSMFTFTDNVAHYSTQPFLIWEGDIYSYRNEEPGKDILLIDESSPIVLGKNPIFSNTLFIYNDNYFGENVLLGIISLYGASDEENFMTDYQSELNLFDKNHKLVWSNTSRQYLFVNIPEEYYSLEYNVSNNNVCGLNGTLKLEADFDLSSADGTPPTITSFKYLDQDRRIKDHFDNDDSINVYFSIGDFEYIFTGDIIRGNYLPLDTSKTKFLTKINGTPEWDTASVSVVHEDDQSGVLYRSELTNYADLDSASIDLKLQFQDQIGNTTQWTMIPAFTVGKMPVIVKVEEIIVENVITPAVYSLSQNYPNPFNPSTTLKYSIPENSKVKVEIFNMLGQRVDVLVNEINTAGHHEVSWDASNLPSGIYMYRLSAISLETRKEFQSVKKMVLIK